MADYLYEDALCYVILAPKPATLGHIKVFPKADVKELEQLDDEITKIKNNRIDIPLINFKKIKGVFPIIIFEKCPPLAPGLWKLYRRKINNNKLLENYLDNLQFMGIDELEMLTALLQRDFSFINILRNKLSSQFRDISFNNFLLFNFFPSNNIRKEPVNEFLSNEYWKFANLNESIFNRNNK